MYFQAFDTPGNISVGFERVQGVCIYVHVYVSTFFIAHPSPNTLPSSFLHTYMYTPPSMVEPRLVDIWTIPKVPTVLMFTSILKQPVISGQPATLYNRQFSRSQLYKNNT